MDKYPSFKFIQNNVYLERNHDKRAQAIMIGYWLQWKDSLANDIGFINFRSTSLTINKIRSKEEINHLIQSVLFDLRTLRVLDEENTFLINYLLEEFSILDTKTKKRAGELTSLFTKEKDVN